MENTNVTMAATGDISFNNGGNSPFDSIRHLDDNGNEYWSARELQGLLGYDKWERFNDAIQRAKIAINNTGENPDYHIPEAGKMIDIGKGAQREVKDYHATRYGAYMVAMNGDPRKPEIAAAQTYFMSDYNRLKQQENIRIQQTAVSSITTNNSDSPFDQIKHQDQDGEFWLAKELQTLLGYQGWDKFKKVIEKGRQTCVNVGEDADYHIRQAAHMIEVGKGAQREVQDYRLTRYACYVIAMNGDSIKPEIAAAQTYFAVKTRQAEVQQTMTPTEALLQTVQALVNIEKEQQRQALVLQQQQGLLAQHTTDISDVRQRVVQGEIVTASQQQRLDQQGAAIADLQRAFDDKGPREEIKGLVSDIVKGTALTDRPFSYKDAYNIFYQFCWQHGRINLAYRLSNLKKRQQAAGWTETKVSKLNALDVIDADPAIWQTVRDVIGILQNFLRETLSKKEEPSG